MPVRDSTPFTDLAPRPFFIPWCQSCGVMAERYTTYPDVDPAFFLAEVQCHGKVEGLRINRAEAIAAQKTGRRITVFKNRDGFNAVR